MRKFNPLCFGADLITQSDSIEYFIFNGTIAYLYIVSLNLNEQLTLRIQNTHNVNWVLACARWMLHDQAKKSYDTLIIKFWKSKKKKKKENMKNGKQKEEINGFRNEETNKIFFEPPEAESKDKC